MDSVDIEVLRTAEAWRKAGRHVVLGTIVKTWGSAPRPVGAMVAIRDDGQVVGSVSGGCVEPAVIREAQEAIRDGRPRMLEYGVSHDRAWEVGLACGGTIQVFVERLS